MMIFLFLIIPSFAYSAYQMKNISFIQEGEVSKVIFEFDKDGIQVNRFENEKDKQIILDFKGVEAPERTMRAFDTSEFEGAAVYISPYKKPGSPNDIRVVIQLRDNVRSFLETLQNRLVLNIENRFGVFSDQRSGKKVTKDKSSQQRETVVEGKVNVPKSRSVEDILENLTKSGSKKYVGKRIHFDVNEIAVSDLLKMIANASGFNIIIDDSVKKASPVTLSLINIPWDQALDTILKLSSLVASKNGNILVIKTIDVAVAERTKAIEAKKLLESQDLMVTKIFPISYANSADLIKTISEYGTKDRGKISFDERTNQLIVQDTLEAVERIGNVIKVLDTQTPQILIQTKLVEVSEGFKQNIGLSGGVNVKGANFPLEFPGAPEGRF